MKMRPHCFLRPVLRPVAVFAIAFGVSALMLSAQDDDAAVDADAAMAETSEETSSDAEVAEAEEAEADAEVAEAEEAEADAEVVEAEEAEEEIELAGDELDVTTSVEEDFFENEEQFNEILSKAITRTNEGEYREAFKLFDDAKAEIEKCEAPLMKAAFAARLAEERKKAQYLYGQDILKDCEKDFKRLLLLVHTDEILDIGETLKKNLICANVVYYLGIPPGINEEGEYVPPSYDSTALQVAIEKDPTMLKDEKGKDKEKFADRVAAMTATTQERIDSQNYWDETSLEAVDPRYNERQREIHLLFRAG